MDLTPIYQAFVAHQWLLFGALFTGLVIALLKQGWLSAKVQAQIPPRYLPAFAVGLGIGSLMVADIVAGKTWQQALFDGFGAATLAVFGHQIVIEGALNGKEIIPPAPGSIRPNVPSLFPPKNTPTIPPVAGVFALLVPLMFGLLLAGSSVSCTPQEAKTAETVTLDLAQMACIEASTLTTAAAVLDGCKIVQTLTPSLEAFFNDLIAQREAAKRAGFHWTAGADAGAPSSDAGPHAAIYFLPGARSGDRTFGAAAAPSTFE